MTFYESNREVLPAGAEIEEFLTEPEPLPQEPPPGEQQPPAERDHTDSAED